MITLEKLMSELKNESVTEIVAGSGWNKCCPWLKTSCNMNISWCNGLVGTMEISTGKMEMEVGNLLD